MLRFWDTPMSTKTKRYIPNVVHTIEKNAYSDDYEMQTLIIGNQTQIIEERAFANYIHLTTVTIQ